MRAAGCLGMSAVLSGTCLVLPYNHRVIPGWK